MATALGGFQGVVSGEASWYMPSQSLSQVAGSGGSTDANNAPTPLPSFHSATSVAGLYGDAKGVGPPVICKKNSSQSCQTFVNPVLTVNSPLDPLEFNKGKRALD